MPAFLPAGRHGAGMTDFFTTSFFSLIEVSVWKKE
jgi:hypothetical protein